MSPSDYDSISRLIRDLTIMQDREDELNPHPEELHRTAEKAARVIDEWAMRFEWQQRDLARLRFLTAAPESRIHNTEELLQKVQQLERDNAALREDRERLDWLEETLIHLSTLSTPDMSGARIRGQLRNKVRDDSGAAGPSYVRIFHPTIRAAIDDARAKEAKS